MKVLIVASVYSHIMNFHLPYLRKFREEGWEVHLACSGALLGAIFVDKTIEVPFKKRMCSTDNLKATRFLRGQIQKETYDLIITHTSLAAFFTRLAVKGMKERPKVINVVHGYLFDDESSYMKQKTFLGAEMFLAPETDLILTMNQWDYETAVRYKLGSQIEKIPGMGVDFARLTQTNPTDVISLRKQLSIPTDAVILIYAAEFSKRKSQHVLIEAMRYLPERCFLILPGEGALLESCRSLAKRMHVADRVICPGQVGDISNWYHMADIAVTASRSEGLPFNVMEAMYCGLPVVASAVKGHVDLIKDGVNGLLYSYADVQEYAESVQELIDDARLRRAIAERAAISVKGFKLERVQQIIMDLYMSPIKEKTTVSANNWTENEMELIS